MDIDCVKMKDIKNCYIHIPFCNKICSYCDFCKIFYNENLVNKYLESLEKEINSIYKGEKLETIYIGGGTPSSLNIKQLEKLFSIINKLNRNNNCSITIEGNFSNTTKEKLDLYKKNNVNRLSFGLESIDKNNLKLLDRSTNIKNVKDVINYSKKIGINDINVDLIYAIPNEDIKILDKDLDFILSLNIEHISTYSLIIEDHTKLRINNIKNIDEDIDYEMYNHICKKLKQNNYIHYEISNFAKEGYYSKHNLCYWNNKNYYGFGLGSSSYIGNKRITNTRSINNYLKGKYISNIEELTKEEEIEYEIILNLRLKDGIDLEKFRKKYKIELKDIYNYNNLVENKLLKIDKNKLYIPEGKLYISNEIIIKLLQNSK